MPRFLSPGWIEEASAAVANSPELAEASAGVHLVVQQVVTGGPDGDVHYAVSLRDGQARLRPGEADDAVVVFSTDWDTAVALSAGHTSAQEAFTSGRLAVGGDVTALLRHGPAFDGLHGVFAGLRERTTY